MPGTIVRQANTEGFISELVLFANRELLSKAGRREITLDEETPLLDLGILDSLSMVSLLTFVQAKLGVAIPTLFVAGREDRIIIPEAVAAARRVPGGRVERLARCGHFPPANNPRNWSTTFEIF